MLLPLGRLNTVSKILPAEVRVIIPAVVKTLNSARICGPGFTGLGMTMIVIEVQYDPMVKTMSPGASSTVFQGDRKFEWIQYVKVGASAVRFCKRCPRKKINLISGVILLIPTG
jgi:hypothetical protein